VLKINPKQIKGSWFEGYALDDHIISSIFLGYNEFGHPQFDNTHSELGEHLYRLKYKSDKSAIKPIVDTVFEFFQSWAISAEMIIPAPPSEGRRPFQPVLELARELATRTGIPVCEDCLAKVKQTPQLKNVYSYEDRIRMLEGAFEVARDKTSGKTIPVMDDLYRSGATLNEIVRSLSTKGQAIRVYVLALTRTRKA